MKPKHLHLVYIDLIPDLNLRAHAGFPYGQDEAEEVHLRILETTMTAPNNLFHVKHFLPSFPLETESNS